MSVKIRLSISKKKDTQNERNADNESKRIRPIRDNQSDRNKNNDGWRRIRFNEDQS